jgi:hypothetical protein
MAMLKRTVLSLGAAAVATTAVFILPASSASAQTTTEPGQVWNQQGPLPPVPPNVVVPPPNMVVPPNNDGLLGDVVDILNAIAT